MRAIDGTKLKEYLTCPRLPYLSFHLDRELELPPTEGMRILFRNGYRVEEQILEGFEHEAVSFPAGDLDAGFQATLELMDRKALAISGGVLKLGEFLGRPDLLLLNEEDGRYEVADIKSSRVAHASAVMQVGFYSRMLGQVRPSPHHGTVIVRDGSRFRFRTADYRASVEHLIEVLQGFRSDQGKDPGPHLTHACPDCRYRDHCGAELEQQQDLSLVPGMTRAQARSLRRAGIANLDLLAEELDPGPLAKRCGLPADLLIQLGRRARAMRDGRPLFFGAPSSAVAKAGFGLAALYVERQVEPAVAVGGQVFGHAEKFRVRFLRKEEASDPQAEFRELVVNLSRSTGPVLVYGNGVVRCLDRMVRRTPSLASGVNRLRDRFVDLRAELRRSVALPGLDGTPLQAARSAGLRLAQEETDLELLRYLEQEEGGERGSVERILRRDLSLLEQLRGFLFRRGEA
ncbi:MAG: TM0106 family RecB-like putative nuclease [Planctomycetota bacterium]